MVWNHCSVCSVTNFLLAGNFWFGTILVYALWPTFLFWNFLVFSFLLCLAICIFFVCLFVSSFLWLLLWTSKLVYRRCWQERIKVKDVIKRLGESQHNIMQGKVCCVKHSICICKSEYESFWLINWEVSNFLKLPATYFVFSKCCLKWL